MNNLGHILELLKSVNIQTSDAFVTFNVVSLFTNIPVYEALQVISNKLRNDDTLLEQSFLQIKAIKELLKVCLKTTYFQVDDKFSQEEYGMAMGNPLSLIISNISMYHLEKLALNFVQYKPSLWLRYVYDTLVICPHGPERLQNFLSYHSSLSSSTHFTMEMESDSVIPFPNVLVIRKEMTFVTKVYRKPTHTGRYPNFKSDHPLHVKRGLIQNLHNRASTKCQE
jgi:hypothetical protein